MVRDGLIRTLPQLRSSQLGLTQKSLAQGVSRCPLLRQNSNGHYEASRED